MAQWVLSGAFIGAALSLGHVVICALALGVLPGGRKPSVAMAWLILVLAVPYLGLVAFLLFGSTSVGRRRATQQQQVNEAVLAAVPLDELGETADDPSVRGFARLNRNLAALPMTGGNSIELMSDYQGSLEAMRCAIAEAQSYVHMQFYISAWDEMTSPLMEELVRATERGVTVRFLFDHLGSRGIPGYKHFVERLRSTDIRWAPMLPIRPAKGEIRRPDLRNHRKILVVDGRVAFTGSQNAIEPSYDKPKNQKLGRQWVELMARVEGPVVQELNLVFSTDWLTETGESLRELVSVLPPPPALRPGALTGVECQVVPSGPGFPSENNLRLFNGLLYAAQSRLSITSPYFVPDESLLYAVTTAAQRGVEVELFVSATADQFMVAHAQRSYYEALLSAGVRIWLYPEPFVLHAKHLTVDDRIAVIGSSNLDMRSFALNYECVLMLVGPDVVSAIGRVQDDYRRLSTELTHDAWRTRSWGTRYVDNVMRLTAALQ